MEILNGKEISQHILDDIAVDIKNLKERNKRIPRLDVIIVGDDYGSLKYVSMKEKVANEVGILTNIHYLSNDTNSLDIVNLIDSLNKMDDVDGIMIQLPLPSNIDSNIVLESISVRKDVDGLTPSNLGKLFQKDASAISPATPLGIIKLLDEYDIKIFGRNVVILGASNIVGIPLLAMFLERHATITLCNSHTVDIEEISRNGDILISATGKPLFVKKNFLKNNCVVIDVGSNRHPETGKLVGDVDWNDIQGIPSYITPVPGGIGPMTIACLMLNLMKCYNNNDRR